ncbi:MAG TPA: flagellar basal-body MS-ring/collar protein FliF [Terracidiphilus sp.]|jgi:flagellar M-ring protein FliF
MATATQLTKNPQAVPGQPQWTDRLAALWGRTRIGWAQLAPRQRSGVAFAALLLAALTGALLWFALRTDWRTLYTAMEPEDARQTGQILTQAQIPFDVTADGTQIRVPAAQLDKARLATAAKGSVKSGRLGFEIFDKPNWVGSEFDEQVNYQRALEGELEHTVGTLADIESARVHLVLPHESLFREEERPAKASVVLKLRRGSLGDGEPEAIRNLVASAVDGLTPDHVVLVDAAGHLPVGPKTAEALALSAEQTLEEKLIATLEPVTGAGNVRASVTLDYDSAATDLTQETYDPSQTVTLSMQRTEQTSGPQPVAAGIPGSASNAPNSQALPVYPQQTTPPQSAKSESGTYATSKIVKHVIENPGRLRRLTAAIVVNDRLQQPAAHGKPALWQPRSADELRHFTALAQAAVGFDSSRGDALTVEDLAFDANRSQPTAPMPQQILAAAENSPLLLKYAGLLIGLLVILAFGVRPALRQAGPVLQAPGNEKARELPAPAAHPGTLPPPEPAATDADRVRSQVIFDQVTSHLKREPSQSSRLLQSWIHSE